ncbi:MAG: type II toxin-antitoxin system HigB family toxin [Acidobacteriaceae bacterium]
MHVISRSTLTYFVQQLEGSKDHRSIKAALDSWFHEVRQAKWKNSVDIKRMYASASIIGAERVVFNIKGNEYRLVAAVDYRRAIVFIKWIGTHKEYDNIDVRTISYEARKN